MRNTFFSLFVFVLFFILVYTIGNQISPSKNSLKRKRCFEACHKMEDLEELESCKKSCIAKSVAHQRDIDYLRHHAEYEK